MQDVLPLLASLTASCAVAAAPLVAEAASPPVEVMIVGDFHMSNPGADLHNTEVDDVLTPARQAEIQRVTDGLARFRPTVVAAEWPAGTVAERYATYLEGALPASRNEVVQLGFRLAKQTGARMIGIDVEGDFPYEAVQAYAQAHGQTGVLNDAEREIAAQVAEQSGLLRARGVAPTLRYLNDPVRIARDNAFYRAMARVGGGTEQPGVDLLTAWYRRNFAICANLVQAAKPGDRVVVFYGAGHTFLLRQCVAETPGLKLVEPNAYLPR
ncbi:MAG: hypothetical protein JNK30_16975 [Phenylobacterium sp.]|uniref:DUF5694 domain-containing protein n=1 Tax=Phenylobacterium sp. TaxID=1871053 RepID=UPI001A518C31|nr:DUF5694 domain-containing protein [Phenylobacterium sp.]MBL8773078.1 hypothetical protein [Phenylobacterium sp.]